MLLTNALGVLLSLALTGLNVEARQPDDPLLSRAVNGPEPSWVDLPIDHFGDYKETFKNRYWYNTTYYKAGGPVFLHDVGESNGDSASKKLLENGVHTGLMRLAKRYNGVGVVWEHRYYGESLPFAINEDTTEAEWQYHTVEQALEDVVYFANSFSIPHPDNHTAAYRPHPNTTPWVFIGGSYPGARAAFIRIRNPETIYASWASSAPVQAQIDMSSYWKTAQRSLPKNCSNDWIAVTKYVDDLFKNGSSNDVYDLKAALIIAEYSGPGGNTTLLESEGRLSESYINGTTVGTAARWLMDPLGHFQYKGVQPIIPFCDVLETQNFTSPAYTEGIYATFGIEAALAAFLVGIAETDPDTFASTDPPGLEPDSLSWAYQYCSEFGFFQGSDPENPKNIQTTYSSLQSKQKNCLANFPFLKTPAVDNINKPYGGWDMNPTHVMFTNGEYDPWRTLSIASFEDNAPGRVGNTRIPRCHTQPNPDEYFGVVYRGQEHCSDLTSALKEPAEPFYTSLALFEMALDEWLPCFNQKLDSNGK